jgi:hypothetical protein
MAGNLDGLRVLGSYTKIPLDRITYVPNADENTIRNIRRGILFLMAFWSVSSLRAFSKLTEVLARLEAENLELVVVDVDGSPDLYHIPEFAGRVHGHGESAWVLDGRIISGSLSP